MKDFLTHYIKPLKGDVLNISGDVIGEHNGAIFYAIGQRHGFNVIKKSSEDPRFFVVSKDMGKNTITVANKDNEKDNIYSTSKILMKDFHFTGKTPDFPKRTTVRIRYRQNPEECVIKKSENGFEVTFDKPQNAISIGQSAVFYDDEICLGGGIIEKTL